MPHSLIRWRFQHTCHFCLSPTLILLPIIIATLSASLMHWITFFFHIEGDVFFESNGGILPLRSLWDFDLSVLHSFFVVDCCQFAPATCSDDNSVPLPLACTTGLIGSVDLLPKFGESFPIIFYTGASLEYLTLY